MRTILITGAGGNLGSSLTQALARRDDVKVIATDIRQPAAPSGVISKVVDVRDEGLADLLTEYKVDAVVHLAAILSPPKGASRDFLHEVEVGGTQNVLDCCLKAGVKRFVYTSSGAAYGYSKANASLLFEDAPLRGSESFPYSWHKRLVEDLLASYREEHPELDQLVFRVSTILGPKVHSPITAMFERPLVLGLRGADTPFCFAWDEDVVQCLIEGSLGDQTGTYNLTGDGVMTLREVAAALGRHYVALPERLLRKGISVAHDRGWTDNTPDQIEFLRHRPVLANTALKEEFGYWPRKSSREVFALYRASRV